MDEIKIVINNKKYTLDEARDLYAELHLLFGKNDTWVPIIPIEYPRYPVVPVEPWYGTDTQRVCPSYTTTSSAGDD